MHIVNNSKQEMQQLQQFEGHGISWEMAVECCVQELEDNPYVLTLLTYCYHDVRKIIKKEGSNSWLRILNFSKSVTGKKMAEMYIEKIRSCSNWDELYIEMHPASRFQKEMKNIIQEEITQWNRIY